MTQKQGRVLTFQEKRQPFKAPLYLEKSLRNSRLLIEKLEPSMSPRPSAARSKWLAPP